jgi:hypothetical protein
MKSFMADAAPPAGAAEAGTAAKYATKAPLIAYCIIMGAVGGFVSVMQRLQRQDCTRLTRLIELTYGRYGIMLASVNGSVFAVLLYVLFATGVMQGDLFPKLFPVFVPEVAGVFPTGITFRHFLDLVRPQTVGDLALILVWSFVAGFAERLVPDALGRFAIAAPPSGPTPAKS